MKNKQRTSVVYQIPDDLFKQILLSAESYSDLLRKCGLDNKGGNINTVKRRIKLMGLSDDHIPKGFGHNKMRDMTFKRHSLEHIKNDIFVNNSNVSRSSIKKYISRHNLIKYVCEKCGNDGTWNERKLSLQLEHKNGKFDDNRIENLCFLCPNCHSQTETYAGKRNKSLYEEYNNQQFKDDVSTLLVEEVSKKYKIPTHKVIKIKSRLGLLDTKDIIISKYVKKRKVLRPSKEILMEDVKKLPFTSIGKKYGVSDNAIRKWCKSMDIQSNNYPLGYWTKIKSGMSHEQAISNIKKEKHPVKKITESEISFCVAEMKNGKSIRSISKELKWTHCAFTSNLIKRNIVRKEGSRYVLI